jgi:glycosyltransferase involved in cell wall biosynthesis
MIFESLTSSTSLWRRYIPEAARRGLQPVLRAALRTRAHLAVAAAGVRAVQPGALIVSGFLDDPRGIGRAARLSIAGLEAAGFAPVSHELSELFSCPGYSHDLPGPADSGVWLIHCNPPEAAHAFERLRPETWRNRYRIGYWAYELPRLPRSWLRAARWYDEVWVCSQFIADALRTDNFPKPVRVMPCPVALGPAPAPKTREDFGLTSDSLVILAMGDFRSSATRKNLAGAVEAYCRAFSQDNGTLLVLKTLGNDTGDAAEALRHLIAVRSDIRILGAAYDDATTGALIAACDIYLSLHRAEGFGLSIAEALLRGRPALATGWSANTEFMSGLDDLLVPYRLVQVNDVAGIYRDRRVLWAEPDVETAAASLRNLAASPALRAEYGARGRFNVLGLNEHWTRERLRSTALGSLLSAESHS